MFSANVKPNRDPRRRRAQGAILCGLLLLSAVSTASELTGSVSLADKPLPTTQIQNALQACRLHQEDMEAAACLQQYWVPRWLMDRWAQDEKLVERAGFSRIEGDILHLALIAQLADEKGSPSAPEVDAYLKKNSRDFNKPLRLRLFRILVATEDEAKELLRELKSPVTIEAFRKLARQHSLDTATHERGGDLGFVWPDGSTDVPQVSAETEIYQAALELEEGQIAAEPVPEGTRFAVLWRRGSLPELKVSEESRAIATLRVREQKTEAALQSLIFDLHEKKVSGRQSILLGKLRRKTATLFRE